MLHAILGLIGAGLAWLAWELAGEVFGGAVSMVVGPIASPIWRVFVTASWPWPSLLLVLVGLIAACLGWSQSDVELATWRRLAGLVAFMGGGLLVVLGPFTWVEARRQRDGTP